MFSSIVKYGQTKQNKTHILVYVYFIHADSLLVALERVILQLTADRKYFRCFFLDIFSQETKKSQTACRLLSYAALQAIGHLFRN